MPKTNAKSLTLLTALLLAPHVGCRDAGEWPNKNTDSASGMTDSTIASTDVAPSSGGTGSASGTTSTTGLDGTSTTGLDGTSTTGLDGTSSTGSTGAACTACDMLMAACEANQACSVIEDGFPECEGLPASELTACVKQHACASFPGAEAAIGLSLYSDSLNCVAEECLGLKEPTCTAEESTCLEDEAPDGCAAIVQCTIENCGCKEGQEYLVCNNDCRKQGSPVAQTNWTVLYNCWFPPPP